MSWYIKAMKNILNFQGRARRKEYWYFTLFMYIFGLLIFYFLFSSFFGSIDLESLGEDDLTDEEIEAMMGLGGGFAIKGILLNIFLFAHAIAALSVTVRRLHDTDRSAWWLLISFVPILQIVLLIFTLTPSNIGSNRYGPCPLEGYDDDDGYDDYPDDEYYDDEPVPANRGQAQRGQRPAHASPLGTQAQNKAGRIAPISDEGLDYSDRFNTHTTDIDNTQLDRRFGLLDSPSPDANTQGASSGLDYVEFTTDDEPSFSHSLDHAEKDRRLGLLAAEGGLSLEAPPPERMQATPASKTNLDKNWEPSAPRNISSIEAETPGGINERFGLMEQTPQTRAPAPAAKTPRYISALPPKGQVPQTAAPARVQRPIARPSSPPAAPQRLGMRPTQQMGTRPTGAPQPMGRPATGAASGLPSINPAVNRPRAEDPAFPDFEPTRQLRPAGAPPAATRPPMQQPPRAQVPQAPHASQVQRAPAGMPNTPQPLHRPQGQPGQAGQQPTGRPAQPGQQPVARPAAQYSNPLAHSGNDALGRTKAGLKPTAPRRAAPSRASEQSSSDEAGNMWSKFLPKK